MNFTVQSPREKVKSFAFTGELSYNFVFKSDIGYQSLYTQ